MEGHSRRGRRERLGSGRPSRRERKWFISRQSVDVSADCTTSQLLAGRRAEMGGRARLTDAVSEIPGFSRPVLDLGDDVVRLPP